MEARRLGPLFACVIALAGCAGGRAQLHQALETAQPSPGRDLEAEYVVRCPDVLTITVDRRPERSGRYDVGPDGRIGWPGRPHVAGLTPPHVAAALAHELGLRAGEVRVQVADYRSQHVYLVGEVATARQVVAYRGPE